MQPVTFQPGQTCQVVKIPVMGSTTPSATPDDLVQDRDVGPGSAVLGIGDFGTVTVVTNAVTSGVPAAPAGVQGNPCAELAKLSRPGELAVTGHGPVTPGRTVAVTGKGYRRGESVAFPSAPRLLAAPSQAPRVRCRSRRSSRWPKRPVRR